MGSNPLDWALTLIALQQTMVKEQISLCPKFRVSGNLEEVRPRYNRGHLIWHLRVRKYESLTYRSTVDISTITFIVAAVRLSIVATYIQLTAAWSSASADASS